MTTLRVRQMAGARNRLDEHWLARFCAFHGWRPLGELGATEVAAFLEYLAVRSPGGIRHAAYRAQCLVFMYREVLGRNLDLGDSFTRRRPAAAGSRWCSRRRRCASCWGN